MAKQASNLDDVNELPGISQAVNVGNTVYLSGQVGWDKDGRVVGSHIGTPRNAAASDTSA